MRYLLSFALIAVFIAALLPATIAQESDSIDPALVQRELDDILSQKEYNRKFADDEPGWFEEWFEDVIARINRWLYGLLDFSGEQPARILGVVVAVLAILLFVSLVVYVVMRLMRLSGYSEARSTGAFNSLEFEIPTAENLLTQAKRLAESGDYRGAFRSAYLASISYLDDIEALRFERSRTNWEYLRELKSGGYDSHYSELRPLTLDFDRKFYGGDECYLADYKKAIEVYQRISSGGAQ